MRHRQRRSHLTGALIFAALVTLIGVVLFVTNTFANPFDFLSIFSQIQRVQAHYAQFQPHFGGHGGIGRPDPPGEDQNDIAWPGILAVLFDTWILCAVTAGYVLVQQTLGLLINRFRATT